GEEENCEICESKCKVCPPHPPKATKNNPLGICDPKQGYPFSKNCLDYLNEISCKTCVDENKNPEDGREKLDIRKNDGTVGVNQNGDFIWSGTSFEKGTGKIIKDTSSSALFPKLEGNNKDVKKDDKANEYDIDGNFIKDGEEIIDCRFAMPIISSLKNTFPIHNDNAFYGVCRNGICQPKECTSDCGKDRRYEKWHDSTGNKVTPIGPFVNLAKTCATGSYRGYTNLKYSGAWADLFSNIKPNCRVEKQGNQGTCYYDMNGKKLASEWYGLPIEDFIKKCKDEHNKNGNMAYYYITTDWNYLNGAYCYCSKAKIELTQFVSITIEFKTEKIQLATLSFIIKNHIKDDREDLRSLLDFVKAWVTG
ncbi:hypothetical protein COV15_02995, partial [Candidatus Woesearchaeota archaeon CG10_big_fil_rev_8_21_14_0_10_34_12]